jgi:hypothetical protein
MNVGWVKQSDDRAGLHSIRFGVFDLKFLALNLCVLILAVPTCKLSFPPTHGLGGPYP